MELEEVYERYLENRATETEVRFLLACFNDPARQAELGRLVDQHLAAETRLSAGNESELDAALRDIYELLRLEVAQARSFDWRRLWPLAAALLIGVVTLALWLRPVNMEQVTARAGERKIIELSDGTRIWLSPSGVLRYPGQFNSNFREVTLEGEAYFEVAKDKLHPFIIHSKDLETRVVGTSFTIRPGSVSVLTGLVRVSAFGHAVLLKPGQQVVTVRQALVASAFPGAGRLLKRKDGILVYEGTPVREVLADISRYYGVALAAPSGSKCLCYGEFNLNQPVGLVLEQLAAAIGARVRLQQGKYSLKGGCGG